jgi:hypothetical protein
MVKRSRILFICVIVVASLLISGCSSDNNPANNPAPKNNVPASVEIKADRLTADITAQGYEVTRGYFKLYTVDDCTYSYAQMGTCYGNNPAAPYIMFGVQPWPEEFVDSATNVAFGQYYPGYSSTFRFDPREAIVILGLMPPPAAYFGLQTYLSTREGTFDTGSATYQYIATTFPAVLPSFFTVVPGNQKRMQIAASLSNSNNNVVVERQSGASFDQERFFITTPDQFMDRKVREALARQSIDAANIFTEPIPSTMKTGLDEHADDFVFFMRYAMPQDNGGAGTPSDTWKKNLPLVVLRVRDPGTGRAPQPYGTFVPETRTAVAEGWLTADLTNLVAAVNNKWGQSCVKPDCSDHAAGFIDLQSSPFNLVGNKCTDIGMNCLYDTQDTTYHSTQNLTLDNGEIYSVVGTLATETGNATYVGLSVNETLMVKGIVNVNNTLLKNTAVSYATTVSNTDKLYVYYFTRDCSGIEALTGGNCFSVTEDMIPACSGSQTCDYMKLVQRRYIKPGTQRGPDPGPCLSPMVIKLKRVTN